MSEVKCNLCGADDYTVRFPKGYAQFHRIVRCKQCGFMYANPQELVDCERFEQKAGPKMFEDVWSRQYLQKQQVQLPDNLRALRRLDTLCPRQGELLEIGSYCGIFLDRIRADGWNTTGLEPDRSVADYSREKFGLKIVDGVLPHPALPEHGFDAVVLLHVIEHMPDPAASLREIHRLLKPGGAVVVETPRFDSLMFKVLGRRERSLGNCNGHIYFFTVPTLRQMLQRNGFEVLQTELVGRTLTVERLFHNLAILTRREPVRRWVNAFCRFLRLDHVRVHVNVHDMQRAYARAV